MEQVVHETSGCWIYLTVYDNKYHLGIIGTNLLYLLVLLGTKEISIYNH